MPPPMNPQGSRAGLITAVVVLSILFVTSAIFAFYFSAEANRQGKVLEERNKILSQYASDEARGDAAISAIADMRSEPANAGKSAIQILMDQRTDLAKQAASLTAERADLRGRLAARDAELKDRDQQLADATKKMADEVAQRTTMQTELTAKFDEQSKQLADAMTQLEAHRKENDQSVTRIQGSTAQALKASQQEASKLQKALQELQGKLASAEKAIADLKSKVPHPENTTVSIIRQADGRIVRVPGNDNVFINLGLGDQITPGMTFEVYDRFSGVPDPGNEEEIIAAAANPKAKLPKGKAAIEVVRLGPGQSECRIIRQTQGTPVVEGDVIANLVYDKNTKYNFVVFGDFDLDQSGAPKPGDADVIKRLVTQWGGRLQNDVTVNTDIVVLGAQPEIPAQEDNETATDIDRRQNAQKALEAYNDVVAKAKDLNVPILNQNKFLYYVGYYEQAQR